VSHVPGANDNQQWTQSTNPKQTNDPEQANNPEQTNDSEKANGQEQADIRQREPSTYIEYSG
jgi:hypothetical protein